jgi:hypothetical protein
VVERSGRTIRLGPRRTIEKNGRWIWGFVPASQLVSYLEIEATTTVDQRRELGMTFSPLGVIRTPSTLHVRGRLTPDRGQP